MCKCGLDVCQCFEHHCLLFIFFLNDSNIQKVAEILPNIFKLSIKKKPIFSINTLRNYKVFQVYGKEFKQLIDIELLYQSINLEGELCQVFIFLDKQNFEEGFSQSCFITQKLYQKITTLIIFDNKNQYCLSQMKSYNMQFQSIVTLTQGLNIHEKILKISDSFAGKVSTLLELKAFQIPPNQNSVVRFQQSIIDFNHKVQERKLTSLEQIEKLIRYLETSRLNLLYVSQTNQEYTNVIKMKFEFQVLKILSEFTEIILKNIEELMKINLQSLVQCKNCQSFGYFSSNKEPSFINTFSNSQCQCPSSQQFLDGKNNLIQQCDYKDMESSMQLLRKKFTKFQQIPQIHGIESREETEFILNKNLKKVKEILVDLQTRRKTNDTYKFQIVTKKLTLTSERDKLLKVIEQIEQQIQEYEQQSKKIMFDQNAYNEKIKALENNILILANPKIQLE
ncbi:unnamed protein product (macronuclear) [Paramecium tetraurelia]|uniref:Uncharacterized protein n=1 Tax=Paramecium tetraurelia TaxID=5888 RepID=A0EE48_PARTE|nr:uncharacterized protein GSPATT00025909001 [Paramecium tetraurelia]CAK93565.1 unnamed protein product [Paramecium tetraurelia]|eukprot:XP_001460962.1 hypothetical protein (macronuclear) [Paramecium tetraurelia strain d4-2]